MKLPRFTATTPPPREPLVTETGQVRATDISALTKSGDVAIWRGVSQIGGAMQQFSQSMFKIYEAEGVSQFATSRKLAKVEMTNLELRLSENNDPATYQKEYAATLDRIKGLRPKNRVGAKEFDGWIAGQKELWSVETDILARRKTVDIAQGAYIANMAAAYDDGDLDEASRVISEAEGAGIITSKAAAQERLVASDKVRESQKQKLLEALHEKAQVISYTDAITFLNNVKGIERAERNDLIARRNRQNEIETATTNPKVRWDTLRSITKDPRQWDDDKIEALVKPNSLTWDDAEEFKKIRDDETNPLVTPRAQQYFAMLDILYADKDMDAKVAYEWDIANEKLMAFFKNNPDATAKQASEVYQEIMADQKSNWLQKLLIPRSIFTEPLAWLAEKRLKGKKAEPPKAIIAQLQNVPSTEFDNIWPSLTDKQKTNVWLALDNGYMPAEILAAMEK